MPHFFCAITCYCCGTTLICIVLNLHIHFFYVLGQYLCTLSCIAATVSYLKRTVSKGKITYRRTDPPTHDAHVSHISKAKGTVGGGGRGGDFRSIFHHTLLCYPPLYFFLVSERLTITGHSFIPLSVFTPLTTHKCMHTVPTLRVT